MWSAFYFLVLYVALSCLMCYVCFDCFLHISSSPTECTDVEIHEVLLIFLYCVRCFFFSLFSKIFYSIYFSSRYAESGRYTGGRLLALQCVVRVYKFETGLFLSFFEHYNSIYSTSWDWEARNRWTAFCASCCTLLSVWVCKCWSDFDSFWRCCVSGFVLSSFPSPFVFPFHCFFLSFVASSFSSPFLLLHHFFLCRFLLSSIASFSLSFSLFLHCLFFSFIPSSFSPSSLTFSSSTVLCLASYLCVCV